MSLSLHEAIVPHYQQLLSAAEAFVAKSRAHFEAEGIDPDSLVDTLRLCDDMAPLRFQIVSVAHHSLGALKACEAGEFAPATPPELGFGGLQALITSAREGVAEFTPETVNALADKDVIFRLGDNAIPFTGTDFLMSFSLPNFYFHVTTAYDLLRMHGAPLGKRDFLGRMRMKR